MATIEAMVKDMDVKPTKRRKRILRALSWSSILPAQKLIHYAWTWPSYKFKCKTKNNHSTHSSYSTQSDIEYRFRLGEKFSKVVPHLHRRVPEASHTLFYTECGKDVARMSRAADLFSAVEHDLVKKKKEEKMKIKREKEIRDKKREKSDTDLRAKVN